MEKKHVVIRQAAAPVNDRVLFMTDAVASAFSRRPSSTGQFYNLSTGPVIARFVFVVVVGKKEKKINKTVANVTRPPLL